MATTPSHGVQAGLIAYYALKFVAQILHARVPALWSSIAAYTKPLAILLVALAAVFGMLPDLLGIYGHAHAALDARQRNDPAWMSARDWSAPAGYYWRAHNADLYESFKLVPFYALHIWVDKFFHKAEGGWNEQGYVLEVVIDVLMLGLIGFELRRARWRRARRLH
jgi:hypothetical protein